MVRERLIGCPTGWNSRSKAGELAGVRTAGRWRLSRSAPAQAFHGADARHRRLLAILGPEWSRFRSVQGAVKLQGALPFSPEVVLLDSEEDVLPREPLFKGARAAGVKLPVDASISHGGAPVAAIPVSLQQQGGNSPIP